MEDCYQRVEEHGDALHTRANPTSRPVALFGDPIVWCPIPTRIQDVIRLKNRFRRKWQLTRDLALKAEANRLQRSVTIQLQEWRNDQWSDTLEAQHPEDQSLWRMTKRAMRVTTPTPTLVTPGEIALSDSEKAEILTDSLEAVSAGSRPIGPGSD
jgi:hypothetical protein